MLEKNRATYKHWGFLLIQYKNHHSLVESSFLHPFAHKFCKRRQFEFLNKMFQLWIEKILGLVWYSLNPSTRHWIQWWISWVFAKVAGIKLCLYYLIQSSYTFLCLEAAFRIYSVARDVDTYLLGRAFRYYTLKEPSGFIIEIDVLMFTNLYKQTPVGTLSPISPNRDWQPNTT